MIVPIKAARVALGIESFINGSGNFSVSDDFTSFIKYFADQISGKDISAELVDTVTVVAFGFAVLMALYFRLRRRE